MSGLLTLAEAAKHVPGRPSASAVWRWCRQGVLAQSGERVSLRHARVGRKIFTKIEWIEEFGEAVARADASYFDAQQEVHPPPESAGAKDHADAERKLEEAGL